MKKNIFEKKKKWSEPKVKELRIKRRLDVAGALPLPDCTLPAASC